MRLSRKRNDDEDAAEKFYTLVQHVEVGGARGGTECGRLFFRYLSMLKCAIRRPSCGEAQHLIYEDGLRLGSAEPA